MLGRRLFAAEVNQTSETDCGPAAVKCLLESHGIAVNYGRLREVCRTEVDGTSVDTLCSVLTELGLPSEQVMLPRDNLLVHEANPFPSLVVLRLPHGDIHFAVAWRRFGPFVQIMDPAKGRYWTTLRRFLPSVYEHLQAVSARDWTAWARGATSLTIMRRQASSCGVSRNVFERLAADAVAAESWVPLAKLVAAVRAVAELKTAGALRSGPQVDAALEALVTAASDLPAGAVSPLPVGLWPVVPAPSDENDAEQLLMRGAVLVRPRRTLPAMDCARATISADAVAQIGRDENPIVTLVRLAFGRSLLRPAFVFGLALLTAATTMVEALILRGLLDVQRTLALPPQRFAAIVALVGVFATMALMRFLLISDSLRLGRSLAGRLILAVHKKLPRTIDAYFSSRPVSDLADRAHRMTGLSALPQYAAQLVSVLFGLTAVVGGIIWLDPASSALAIVAGISAGGVPLLTYRLVAERDMRVRTYDSILGRLQLDALLGLLPVKAHAAERAMRYEHESLLSDWARAVDRFRRAYVGLEGVQSLLVYGSTALLVVGHVARSERGIELLLVYWALQLPVYGAELAATVRQYAGFRNLAARAVEPLGAPGELSTADTPGIEAPHGAPAVAVTMSAVTVRIAAATVLQKVDLQIEAGEHVAIVGPSGAGKTTLVSVLLGWRQPTEGSVLIDGERLDESAVSRLRLRTAWVDPSVRLWNRSLLENLLYGAAPEDRALTHRILEQADLWHLLATMPDGLETQLGEGGGFVAGGEGQRVRVARALMRARAALVILDEPFRGLDRRHRRRLLANCRTAWCDATLLFVTHNVSETRDFSRVIVVDRGCIVEDGAPATLASTATRYQLLLAAEEAVQKKLWRSPRWRHAQMAGGKLTMDVDPQ
jgi:ATP-binding cassette subfamily B protein